MIRTAWNTIKPFLPSPAISVAREVRYQATKATAALLDIKEKFSPVEMAFRVPAPPASLRTRVNGDADLNSFRRAGRTIASNVSGIITKDRESFDNVLDFGCGCGRVISHLHEFGMKGALTGVDVDRDLIEWSQKHLPFARFIVGPADPPLPFSDNSFDCIFSVSVFTHLDEVHCIRWANELTRILSPGGVLLVTIHGPSTWPEETKADITKRGFCFQLAKRTSWFAANKCDWYGSMFMDVEFSKRLFSSLTLRTYLQKGINRHQDALLFTKA